MVAGKKEVDCMTIGIDARLWSESGIGRYIRNLIFNLAEIDNQNEYFVFLLDKNFDSITLPKNFTKVRANYPWYGLKEQVSYPKLLNKYNLDLMHFPHFNVPIFYKGKFVVTIHDLIHQHFQMRRATTHGFLVYKLKQEGYKRVFSSATKKSQKIITVSNYVKNKLTKEWKINPAKIIITTEGVEENILEIAAKVKETQIKTTLHKFNIKQPFIFYAGNAHPHKNVEGLIKAFLELRKNYQYLQLVLAGQDHYFWQRIKDEYVDKNIIYAGYVTDLELVAFYKSAKEYVVPSFEEGFGIPLLEAMACGCPVVSSNRASLPEVGGDGALYFVPENLKDMSEKIMQVLNNEKLREELIEKGKKRYKQFSWKKLAKETLEIYKSV